MNDPRAAANLEAGTVTELASKHEALITALADLIWPVIRERINSAIDARIDEQLENKMDQGIANYLKYTYDIDQQINDYMSNHLDQQISEYMSNHFDLRDYDINDIVEDYMNDRLEDMVHESVSNLTFEVNVSR
nr:hypothetical protein NCPCFENI_01089 [Cupriavidus sp.]